MIMCSFFFFKQKTAYEISVRDWSSDVCSSDLAAGLVGAGQPQRGGGAARGHHAGAERPQQIGRASCRERGERLCRSRWSPYHLKKKKKKKNKITLKNYKHKHFDKILRTT